MTFGTLKLYGSIGLALVLVVTLGLHRAGDRRVRAQLDTLTNQAGAVLVATRAASDNPSLRWVDVAEQIGRIGKSQREWRATADLQTARINDLGLETARLKALNADLRKQAEAHIAKRQQVIARLETQALSPGERSDCARQLRLVEEALDLVFREGM
jgi:hypothetical protein